MATLPIARTSLGALRGAVDDGVCVFRGVPYAAAPVGSLRFAPPAPMSAWTGERDAGRHGAIPPQPPSRLSAAMGDVDAPQAEDCLTLTISTPAADGKRRPVLLWLHGGAFWTGAGSLDWYSGVPMARTGDVVVVGVNYRLGALGFMHLDGVAPANLGLLDQFAALEWVAREIAAFGGDPDNITVMGQSAGGLSILALLGQPQLRSRFRRVIIQSAPFGRMLRSREDANAIGRSMQKALELRDGAGWASVEVQAIVKTQMTVARSLARFADSTPPFIPVSDHLLLGHDVIGSALAGAAGCEVMIGYTRDEMGSFFTGNEAVIGADEAAVRSVFARHFGADADAAMAEYRTRARDHSAKSVLGELQADASFASGVHDFARRLADLGRPAWVYRFDWSAPGNPFGACHCGELPFMFDTLPAWRAPMLDGGDPDGMARLAAQMRAAWVAFARHGDPNHPQMPQWPRYKHARQTMLFDQHSRVAEDPAGKDRWKYWP